MYSNRIGLVILHLCLLQAICADEPHRETRPAMGRTELSFTDPAGTIDQLLQDKWRKEGLTPSVIFPQSVVPEIGLTLLICVNNLTFSKSLTFTQSPTVSTLGMSSYQSEGLPISRIVGFPWARGTGPMPVTDKCVRGAASGMATVIGRM